MQVRHATAELVRRENAVFEELGVPWACGNTVMGLGNNLRPSINAAPGIPLILSSCFVGDTPKKAHGNRIDSWD